MIINNSILKIYYWVVTLGRQDQKSVILFSLVFLIKIPVLKGGNNKSRQYTLSKQHTN